MTSRWTSAFGLMSWIATNPSARLTTVAGTSPRTIWQKTQSSGSEDPLLGDRRAARPYEVADAAQVGARVVATPHRRQDAVVARLERHVQVARHRGRLAQRGEQALVQVVDLDRREAEPGEPGRRTGLADEPGQVVPGPAVAVAAEVDARQHDFAMTLLDAPADLAQDG